MSDKPLIAAPRELDRRSSLISLTRLAKQRFLISILRIPRRDKNGRKIKGAMMKKLFDYLKTALQNISVGGVLAYSDCVVFVALCAVIYALFLREIL